MIEISLLTGELIFAAVWLFIRLLVWIVRRKIDWKREAQLLLMAVNLAVIIRFTFFPLERVNGRIQPLLFDPDAILPFKLNLIPFHNLFAYETKMKALLNIIGNFALFIPSGVILPVLYHRLNRFWKVLLTGAGLSLCIELLQLLFCTRTTDTNDLILNTLGAAAGYGIYALIRTLKAKSS